MYFRFMFAYFCVCFLRLFSKQQPSPSPMSATPRYTSIVSPSLSILASSTLICMRAVLRSALIARRGHLGIKKCQSPEQYRATHPVPSPTHPRSNLSLSYSQRTITISFSVWSQSKIVLCTSCLVGWQLPVESGPWLLMFTTPHQRPEEGQGRQGFLLRNHR